MEGGVGVGVGHHVSDGGACSPCFRWRPPFTALYDPLPDDAACMRTYLTLCGKGGEEGGYGLD